MVAIIEGREEAGTAQFIEFRIERSPEDPGAIVARWRLAHGERTIEESKPGNSILAEFRYAVDCADQHGIPFVWVNDPEELFPPWERL